MKQNGGGTDLLTCLKKCSFLLQTGRNCRKAIIIITDDDVRSARSYSQQLTSVHFLLLYFIFYVTKKKD